jgi:hypothetical protein
MISKYVDFLNREDIKKNLKQMIHPIGELILEESKPCLFYIALFLFVHFILTLCILIYIIRLKYFLHIIYDIKVL